MSDDIWPILSVSLKVSLCTTALVMLTSIVLGFWLVRPGSKLARAIEMLVYVPMALPPVALGYGLLLLIGRNSFLGSKLHDFFGVDIAFTTAACVCAASAVSLGIGVRAVKVALQ